MFGGGPATVGETVVGGGPAAVGETVVGGGPATGGETVLDTSVEGEPIGNSRAAGTKEKQSARLN